MIGKDNVVVRHGIHGLYWRQQNSPEKEFFSEYGDASRYKIIEVVGKGSYGVVCSAIDTLIGEKVAIKKIHVYLNTSDAARILGEIKLLRLLRHPDIVEIKHVMLPPSRRDFKDIYVVFELMESDLHQVIKANDDLMNEHYQFFLYQLLRALKYIHTGVMTVSILLGFNIISTIVPCSGSSSVQYRNNTAIREPLLQDKVDDDTSLGSSYDSVSQDDGEDQEPIISLSKLVNECDPDSSRTLCSICFDDERNCCFFPCGHCATCFACGTSYEEVHQLRCAEEGQYSVL